MNIKDIIISTDRSKLQPEVIHAFLSSSYWASGIPLATMLRSFEHSICFGVYYEDKQVGFARVVTDETTFAYLADVFILEEFRGKGIADLLMKFIMDYPALQGLRRWLLATRDAHGLYAKHGFKILGMPGRWMEVHNPAVYADQK